MVSFAIAIFNLRIRLKECNWKVKVTFFNTKLLQSEKLLSVGQVLLFEDADLKSTIALEELVRC